MRQDTLANRIRDDKPITEVEIDQLVSLLGSGCRATTKARLALTLRFCPHLPVYGIYDRVLLSPRVQYMAGQSYPDEIRTVRHCLIGR